MAGDLALHRKCVCVCVKTLRNRVKFSYFKQGARGDGGGSLANEDAPKKL